MFRHTYDPTYWGRNLFQLYFVDLEYFDFPKSVMIPYLLLNLRLPFKASVKNKGFFS